MRWNELTGPEFITATEKSAGVCLLPLGVIEKHGNHLPLGIDYMKAWHFADLASKLEPAVVFPPFFTGFVNAAKFEAGTIAYELRLVLDVLEATCREIARNGFKKIILVNAHGGNTKLLQTFLRSQLEAEKDYIVYLCEHSFGKRTAIAKQQVQDETGGTNGHGGAYETAVALHLFPECVKMDKILPREAGDANQQLIEKLGSGVSTPIDWYAKHNVHLGGYGGGATAKHGKMICEAIAQDLADTIRNVKADQLTTKLLAEFHHKSKSHGK